MVRGIASAPVLVALALAGCGSDAPREVEPRSRVSAVVVGSAATVRPAGAVAGAAGAVLVAARNEFESFQVVVVAAGDEPVRELTVSFGEPLVGPGGATIPAGNVTIYRVGYYEVTTPSDPEGAPGRWPDPLVPAVDAIVGEPRDAFPVEVPAGENRVAWVDVLVPEDALPGVYRGSLDVRTAASSARVPVKLTVLALVLPSTTRLASSFGLSGGACRALAGDRCDAEPGLAARIRERFVRVALDNRISLANPHASPVPRDVGEAARELESVFLPYFDGTGSTRLRGARLTTFQVNGHRDRNVAGWKDVVARLGLEDRAYVWSCDEPFFFPVSGDPAGNWGVCRAKLEADHASWPAARKMVTTHIQSTDEVGTTDLVDIITLNIEFLHGRADAGYLAGDQRPLYDAFLSSNGRPKALWLYSACGSHGCGRNDDADTVGWAGGYQIDAPASRTRAMPWIAFSYRMGGILYYDTVMQLDRAWDDQYRFYGNGEGTLFYPGTPGRIRGTTPIPLESIRLKLLRDGYEDYEYLAFLEDHGRGADAHRIARALFPAPFDTTRTDAEVQRARRELATIVADLTGGPSP
ncbi:MAG TPA: hypothetical protein VD838_20070 [Anaeromyxobacteraceae bacterium]|nr:hypothetical protein [Anaeromyxobacteraceae bacterium]